MTTLTGPQRLPVSGAVPDSLVVLLHGIGSSGDDLIGLADSWTGSFSHTAFYAPHAPHPFEDAPFGYQWYSRRAEHLRVESLYQVEALVDDYIDELLAEHQVEPSRCILVGFSQGTIVALHVAPRRSVALGGVIGFSGLMVAADGLRDELGNKSPICLIHGAADPVLPSQGSEAAGRLFDELGVPNEVHILPGLAHAIDQRGIELATRFMRRVLG